MCWSTDPQPKLQYCIPAEHQFNSVGLADQTCFHCCVSTTISPDFVQHSTCATQNEPPTYITVTLLGLASLAWEEDKLRSVFLQSLNIGLE